MKFVLVLSFCISNTLTSIGQNRFVESSKEFFLKDLDGDMRYSIVVRTYGAEDKSTITLSTGRQEIDSLTFFDVRGVDTLAVEHEHFIMIKFRKRGGTNTFIRRLVLICVSNGRLYVALEFPSDVVSRVKKIYDKVADSLRLYDESEDYHISVTIKLLSNQNYKAILYEEKKIASRIDITRNIDFQQDFECEFDKEAHVFYNSVKSFSGQYSIYEYKTSKIHESMLAIPKVHSVDLYFTKSYFIDGRWYLQGNGNHVLISSTFKPGLSMTQVLQHEYGHFLDYSISPDLNSMGTPSVWLNYMIIIGIPSAFDLVRGSNYEEHHDFYTEQRADQLAEIWFGNNYKGK